MTYKECPKCQKHNAIANRNCVKCGRMLLYEPVLHERRRTQTKQYWLERLFSSVLVGCAVVSLFFALMAFLEQPAFTIIPFQ